MTPALLNPKYAAELQMFHAVEAERKAQRDWEWENGGRQHAESYIGRSIQFLSSSPHERQYGHVIGIIRGDGDGSWRDWRLSIRFAGSGVQTQAAFSDVKFID